MNPTRNPAQSELVLAVLALTLEQREIAKILSEQQSSHSPEEIARLKEVGERVDAALIQLNSIASLAHHTCIAIGAFRCHMLDEEINLVNKHFYQRAIEPFKVDCYA